MTTADFSLDRLADVPTFAGIYAIVNSTNGHRYVGQATNIRERIATHIRDLDAGRERTNAEMLLQNAWLEFGREAFAIRILEEVPSNLSETHYHVRPDNLNLAEHYYINEKSEYNKDKRIVRDEFMHLIQSRAWRKPIDDETRAKLLKVQPRPYLVGKRKTWEPSAVVLAFNHEDAKVEATMRSGLISALGRNLSTKRLSSNGILRALESGATDLRRDSSSERPEG
jgi:group I intron endonuclease